MSIFMLFSISSLKYFAILNLAYYFDLSDYFLRCAIFTSYQSKEKKKVKLSMCLSNRTSRYEELWRNGGIAPTFF